MAKAYRYRMPHNDYAGEVETHGFTAANATTVKPGIIPGFWPRWTGEAWEQIEDHRKRTEGGAVPSGAEQEATEYWLPGDTWQTSARVMVEIGPLPEGALLKKPEPTEAELAAQRIAAIDAELQALEQQADRPSDSITLAIIKGEEADSFDVKKLEAIEAQKIALREERASLATERKVLEG